MMMEKGGISVSTEHIFPVIKRWLYSDKDIFVREVVSNACDAITKHKRLVSLSQAEELAGDYRVDIRVDKDKKTITFSDNGIGMTDDEVKKYINNIALSGALDFISQYEGDNAANGIIGHFGLGFYSVFMIADRVELHSKSYTDAPAVLWECSEAGEFSMQVGTRGTQGTDLILHVSDSELAYLDSHKLRDILDKYCAFMPYDIYLSEEGAETEPEKINDTNPLWLRSAQELTDEDYKEFYKKVFRDYRDPLFWVHINADYPLNFKGVLFFPASRNEFEQPESEIKLFYNSVFVADNIKEACPEYLINLRGVLDCPELPLNVSRSYLQDNIYIKKLAEHIGKKVADRLNAMKNTDRAGYEAIWQGIQPYMEYACLRDNKFYERAGDSILLKKQSGGYALLEELLPSNDGSEPSAETSKRTLYYTTDVVAQSYYVELFAAKGHEIIVCDLPIDANFLHFLEGKKENLRFLRVDSDFSDISSTGEEDKKTDKKLEKLFRTAANNDKLEVRITALGEEDAPCLIAVSEESRRMQDMMRAYRSSGMDMGGELPVEEQLTINRNSPLVAKLLALAGGTKEEKNKSEQLAKHMFMSALLLSRRLTPTETNEFIKLNSDLLGGI